MPIRYVSGSVFQNSADAQVNTVNCYGAMGKGIAEEAKNTYPAILPPYRRVCKRTGNGTFQPGMLQLIRLNRLTGTASPTGDLTIVNFATKDHWENASQMPWVEAGLDRLVRAIRERGWRSIAIPPLGCGNGKLHWPTVRALIERKLAAVAAEGVDVMIFGEPPAGVARTTVAPVSEPWD